jgi:hypothetical protein
MGENVAPLASGELDDPYQPFYRNEKYPRGLRVDFRKLQVWTDCTSASMQHRAVN